MSVAVCCLLWDSCGPFKEWSFQPDPLAGSEPLVPQGKMIWNFQAQRGIYRGDRARHQQGILSRKIPVRSVTASKDWSWEVPFYRLDIKTIETTFLRKRREITCIAENNFQTVDLPFEAGTGSTSELVEIKSFGKGLSFPLLNRRKKGSWNMCHKI